MSADLSAAIISSALGVLTMPVFDPNGADEARLRAVQAEAETQRAITKAWLGKARGDKYTLQRKGPDESLMTRVETADRMWAERIRLVQAEWALRKARRAMFATAPSPSTAERERDDAQEKCRRLAAEVERLQADLAEARKAGTDSRRHRAFYESAQFILADSTFKRIDEKARMLLATLRYSNGAAR